MTSTICYNLVEEKPTDLHLICVADKDNEFTLYEDDGRTIEYQTGKYCETVINMIVKNNISIEFIYKGSYPTDFDEIFLDVVYPNNAPVAVKLDEQLLPRILYNKKFDESKFGWHYNLSTKSIEIKFKNPKKNYKVEIFTNTIDLLGM